MKIIKIGDYIKEQRMKQDMTQDELSRGICTSATLSRLENNQQTPKRSLINALLQRLGLPDDRFFAILSENEERIEALQKQIRADQIRFRRAGEEERPQIRKEALEKVAKLEEIVEDDDPITRQYILSTRAVLGRPEGPYSVEVQLEMLMDAIRLTVPHFDLEEIAHNRYSIEEITLINQIAQTYRKAGEKRKAIDIYYQLLKYIEKNDQALAQYAEYFCLTAHNCAIALGYEKRYEEAIELAKRGKKICTEYGAYQFLPGFLTILAGCYYFMDNNEESVKQYIMAHCLYTAVNDEVNLIIIEEEMKKRLGINPPI